jgi:hypothetical protein
MSVCYFVSSTQEPSVTPFALQWADKRADMKKIKIPAYISGSDFSSIHTMGSIRGFWDCQGPKWIRWSGRQVRSFSFLFSSPFSSLLPLITWPGLILAHVFEVD